MALVQTGKFCTVTTYINISQNVAWRAYYWPVGQRVDTKLTIMLAGGTGHVVLCVLCCKRMYCLTFTLLGVGVGGRGVVGLKDLLLARGPLGWSPWI